MEKYRFGLPGIHSYMHFDTNGPSHLMTTHIQRGTELIAKPYLSTATQLPAVNYPLNYGLFPVSDVLEHRKDPKTLSTTKAVLHMTPRLIIDVQTLQVIGLQRALFAHMFAMGIVELQMSRDGIALVDPMTDEAHLSLPIDEGAILEPDDIRGVRTFHLPLMTPERSALPGLSDYDLDITYNLHYGSSILGPNAYKNTAQRHLDPRYYDGIALHRQIDPSVQIAFAE